MNHLPDAPSPPIDTERAPRALPLPGQRQTLAPGLQVSPICLGIVADPRIVPAAFDSGINFFFVSADMHWPLYQNTRQGLQDLLARGGGIRDQIVVSAVTYVAQPEFCWAPFTEVLDAVPGLERIDVTIAGGAYSGDYLTRMKEHLRHRRERWVGARAIGTTFHDRSAAILAVNHRLADIAFVRYNVAHPGAEQDLFPHLVPRPRPLLYNFKNTEGAREIHRRWEALALEPQHWKPEITDFYRFVLGHPALDGALIALGKLEQVDQLHRALGSGPLTPEERGYLIALSGLATGRARRASPVG